MAKKKQYVVLATNPSKSKPNAAPHQIRMGGDNVTYCTCWAWRMSKVHPGPKTCKHLERYRQTARDMEGLTRAG